MEKETNTKTEIKKIKKNNNNNNNSFVLITHVVCEGRAHIKYENLRVR